MIPLWHQLKSTQQYSADGWAGWEAPSWFHSHAWHISDWKAGLSWLTTEPTLGLSSMVVSEWTFYRQLTSPTASIPKEPGRSCLRLYDPALEAA